MNGPSNPPGMESLVCGGTPTLSRLGIGANKTVNPQSSPAILEPVMLVLTRPRIEAGDADEALDLLQELVSDTEVTLSCCGRVSLVIDGYNDDPRELFEVAEVRAFLQALDARWPYWYFFLSQADDSIKLLESCLCDSIEVVPGVNAIDTEQLTASLTRHFAALNRLCEAINLPEQRVEEITEGVISLIRSSSIERLDAECYE